MNIGDYSRYNIMLNQWLIIKQSGEGLDIYLKNKGFKEIAIYGMGIYGRHLVRELQGSAVRISYGIDRKKMASYNGVEVFQLGNGLLRVDAIVNTVINEHESVYRNLREVFDCPIINLEDLVFDSYE